MLPLPALGQMPPQLGPCVPHGSSVLDQAHSNGQDVMTLECVSVSLIHTSQCLNNC